MSQLYLKIAKFFPIPRILEMRYAGIHISSSNHITYLECVQKGNVLIPSHFERVSFERRDESDSVDLIKKLGELHSKYGTQFVKATVPEYKSYLFEAEIPKVEEKDTRDAVAYTIEDKAPVTLSEVVFGYRVTDDSKKDTINVSVGVVPKEVIQNYINIYEKAGMYPVTFKVEAQSVANAVVPLDSKEDLIIATIKGNKMIIAIVQNGGVFMSSTVEIGGDAFNSVLRKAYPTATKEEIEEMKYKENIIARGTTDEVSSGFLEQCSLFKNHINKYYIYWLTHKAALNEEGKKLSRIIVVGRDSTIPGFIDYLKANLKVPVEVANVWVNCFDIEKYIPIVPYKDSFDYAESIGMLVHSN